MKKIFKKEKSLFRHISFFVFFLSFLFLLHCDVNLAAERTDPFLEKKPECDLESGGIQLPDGFCAVIVADNLGPARHLTINKNGDIYVALRRPFKGGGIVALRDKNGDGKADVIERFGSTGGTGIGIWENHLYFASDKAIFRYRLTEGKLLPEEPLESVVINFPMQWQHAAKSFVFDNKGWLYVNVGAPSNACQKTMRTPGSPGMDPCPQLERQGGIWRFQADLLGQKHTKDGTRYATGIRNAVAIDWNPVSRRLYAVQHGRDQLHQFWPDLYTIEQGAELPAEEFMLLKKGSNFGWPYCYYDQIQGKKVLAPEYGGDGKKIGRCDRFENPIMAFPGHWAPNDLLFYTGKQFPKRYFGGAFIAFHGSWNRAPLGQQGYKVVFVPFEGERPSGDPEVFADGFAGILKIKRPGHARFRPMGFSQGPDGSLYIIDSKKGRLWRVIYMGSK